MASAGLFTRLNNAVKCHPVKFAGLFLGSRYFGGDIFTQKVGIISLCLLHHTFMNSAHIPPPPTKGLGRQEGAEHGANSHVCDLWNHNGYHFICGADIPFVIFFL
jgi:hypothetical protein